MASAHPLTQPLVGQNGTVRCLAEGEMAQEGALGVFGRAALPRCICSACRRFPNLLYRRLPSRPTALSPAGLETCDTADSEVCGTLNPYRAAALPCREAEEIGRAPRRIFAVGFLLALPGLLSVMFAM
jgi:hypothetical protein